MKLEKLLEGILYELKAGSIDKDVKSLCYDSRKVEKGSCFVCLTGFNTDGHEYIDSALEKGADPIIVEKDVEVKKEGVTVIKVVNSRVALSRLASNFFGNPAGKLILVGVTGTKGKTTTTHMCKSIMESSGVKVGMIGTLGAYIGSEHIETKNTTPESYELQELFKKMADAGCKVVFMEVSSQAVKLRRIEGLQFAIGAFTNLSPDHIGAGEHADFEEYKNC
ncbi:MAG: UDP-N-acetylmuramoyl-L-alanyl-D-glutamate--2,6-diaminopimelate ligase, partial [Lachnospiraceae bacterium]|nr:UDP-N-acetylmuramoyl-L-alanyl-D-glutamate--2,6-diaminopimelate ligase [Lachnospiraceae bacterium]